MNKKSEISDYMIAFVPRFLFLVVMLVSIYFLVHTYVKTEVDTFDAESALFVDRLIYSRDGLCQMSQGQVTPGIIDASRLQYLESNLTKNIVYPDSRHIAAKVSIKDMGSAELFSFYYNKDWFDRWIVLSKYSGSSASTVSRRSLYFLLKGKSELDKLLLKNQISGLQSDPLFASSQELVPLQKQLDELSKKPKDDAIIPVWLEIIVVMPNS
ncbi:MAG: hypothetical protein V1837_07220 [Candidatus Woesearchaeota archaeon]